MNSFAGENSDLLKIIDVNVKPYPLVRGADTFLKAVFELCKLTIYTHTFAS